jgi:hypothetical protein
LGQGTPPFSGPSTKGTPAPAQRRASELGAVGVSGVMRWTTS